MKNRYNARNVICLVIICLTVVLVLFGCDDSKTFKIDDHNWKMSTVQAETNNGDVVAYGTAAAFDGTVIDLIGQAKESSITLIDNTNNKHIRVHIPRQQRLRIL